MQVGVAKQRCALQNGFFEKSFKRVFEREALSDPVKLARQNRIQQAKKNLGKAFLPCNGVKKPWENTHTNTPQRTHTQTVTYTKIAQKCSYPVPKPHTPTSTHVLYLCLLHFSLPPAVVQVVTMGLYLDRLNPWVHSQSPGKSIALLDATLSPHLPRKAVVTGLWQEVFLV